ncbi:MAG: AEC family transporter [Lachnospiraceae bacterium]|nr:AEC family transporter [Lachnospiraceae bacterium]
MDTFLFSINATLPVFLTIVVGYVLKRLGFFSEEFTVAADRFTFRVTLPVLLFTDIATADLSGGYDIRFMLFCMGVSCAAFFLIWGGAALFLKEKEKTGAFVMASFRGSAAVLGIALVKNIYGSTGLAPLMVVSVVPFYNAFSVIILTLYAKRDSAANATEAGAESDAANVTADGKTINKVKAKIPFGKILLEIVTNPLILAVALALPFSFFGWKIPAIPGKVLSNLLAIATPFALVILGAGFTFRAASKHVTLTAVASFIKVVLLPLMFVPAAIWFGFRDEALVAIAVMLASPSTVACYIMARNMKNDAQLVSSIVMVTTLVSSVTITAMIFILRSFEFI